MIKIQIKDKKALRLGYLKIVQPLIMTELKKLKLSLSHLRDYNCILDKDINDAKHNTAAIVNMIGVPKKDKGYFNKPLYINGIKNWQNGTTTINPVNLKGLAKLVDILLDPKKIVLKKLLISDADKLKKINDDLLIKYGAGGQFELDIIKLAFKYKDKTIGRSVRDFFYQENFTTYCPYCNQNLAIHTENETTGVTADQFQLDHFFDQDKHPLLALSLFNLVPADYSCNAVNKGTKGFSDELHMNPYTSGFKQDMLFLPQFDPLNQVITSVKLKIEADRKSTRYKQLVGDYDDIHKSSTDGNLNVFQIHTKYNRREVIKAANRIFALLKRDAINKKSLNDILKGTGMASSHQNFSDYFYEKTGTPFHENEFGEQAYSKFYRDILDFIYKKYPMDFNIEVKKIIEDSYLPGKGGE